MKQTITITRKETRVIDLEVPQALTPETLERLANEQLTGVGAPSWGSTTTHTLSPWVVGKASGSAATAKPKRKGR